MIRCISNSQINLSSTANASNKPPYYWEKHYAAVLGCNGTVVYGNKFAIPGIIQPYLDMEIIRLSDYLPGHSWYGSSFC